MNIERNDEHPNRLAGVPGFHGLARTALTGLAGPGSAVLDVFCTCDDTLPVARITVRLQRKKAVDDFTFVELGKGEIAIGPALDLLTGHGHFLTPSVWTTSPDGWMQVGPLASVPERRWARSGKAVSVTALTPTTARAIAKQTRVPSAEDPCGACRDPRGEHDPCSACIRRGVKKPCRSFVEPKR